MKKPNILFLFADDERYDTINAWGNKDILTPNLDKLAQDGVSFTHAHIPGGTTGAVCMPSRAMLHTGRSLFNIDKQGQEIPADHVLLGELLIENGYETFGAGKWHNGKSAYARSFTDGDSIFFGGMHDHWMVPLSHFDPTGQYSRMINSVEGFMSDNKPTRHTCEYVRPGEHSTDIISESIIKFLDKPHDKPFFAYASFLAPHDPRTMPQEFLDMYDEEKLELPPNFMSYHPIEYGQMSCRDEVLAPYPRTPENTKKQLKEYYAMITHLDYQIGNIINKLEEIGEKDNTIIIYAADNGLALGQHGLFGKQNLFEHSVRVPLIFAGTGINKNETRTQPVFLYDIFPSLCDLLEIEIPSTVGGISFAKTLNNGDYVTREEMYLAYTDKIRAIKKDGFKYMEHRYKGLKTCSLYDLINDPYETSNLYYNKEYTQKAEDLKVLLQKHSEQSNELNQEMGQTFWAE